MLYQHFSEPCDRLVANQLLAQILCFAQSFEPVAHHRLQTNCHEHLNIAVPVMTHSELVEYYGLSVLCQAFFELCDRFVAN